MAQSKVQIPEDNRYAFRWSEIFHFRDDTILSVRDQATFDTDGKMVDRKFAYDFRSKGSDQPLWRICNHYEWRSVNDPCHVHVGHEDNRVECFPTSHDKDFLYAIHCVKLHFLQKPQDWDEKGE